MNATTELELLALMPHRAATFEIGHAARRHRTRMLRRVIVALARAVGSVARRAYRAHRRRVEARAMYDALRQLDDRVLHDIGVTRSELTSVAAEATGEATHTRALVLCAIHGSR
jgi:uncharacterized protein YjiS (DUF1127 family)